MSLTKNVIHIGQHTEDASEQASPRRDAFAKLVEEWERHYLIPSDRQRRPSGKLSLGEVLFLMIDSVHISAYKDFKHFRLYGLPQE